jgi:hypothetical protein
MAAALEARETLSGEEALAIVADAGAHVAVAPQPTRAAS